MQRQETMRRIQAGFLGLGLIIALLVIASAIMSRFQSEPAKTAATLAPKPADKPSPPAEPLAKLGIAPEQINENKATAR